MKKIVVTGKTIQDAINTGLQKWNVPVERVNVNVIDQPAKGFIGIGSKDAKIELELIPDPLDEAICFLKDLFILLKLNIQIHDDFNPDGYLLNMTGQNLGIIIGKKGYTLDALQHIVNTVANHNTKSFTKIHLDAENFRIKRKRTLERLATQMASKVIQTNRDVMLESMSASERKIIHFELQDHPVVKTYSIGEEPNRKVVITFR
jgi:spoIIIJ-associated protein